MNNPNSKNPGHSGYLHPNYAQSLAEFGKPRELINCGGWILEREIPGLTYADAMGCYPIFVCRDWSQIHLDMEMLADRLISVSLVTDPFGSFDIISLKKAFDFVFPFKEHYIIDCTQSINKSISKNHNYQARKAFKKVQIEIREEPWKLLDEWTDLYDVLIRRHQLKGFHAPSKEAFSILLKTPGLIMFRAIYQNITIGAMISFIQEDKGYAHLVASNKTGYELGVSYALYWSTINFLVDKVRWISIGASAGVTNKQASQGLDFFKQGWSNQKKTTYFCGRILNPQKYSEIVASKGISNTDYFPAYRDGEFS